jgi:biotin carboxylase
MPRAPRESGGPPIDGIAMKNVAFVAPFLLPNTARFIQAALDAGDCRVAVVTADDPGKLPPRLRSRVSAWAAMPGSLDADSVVAGVRKVIPQLGSVDVLMGMLEQLQVPLAEARERLGIPGMNADTARNFRDKDRMKRVLAEAGLTVARNRRVEDLAPGLQFAREVGYPVVVKPLAGAGAVATFRADDDERLLGALGALRPSAHAPVIIEEFLVGDERSFEVVTKDGEPVWHSLTHYAPSPLTVLQNPWIQWTVLLPREVEDPQYDDVRQAGFAALKALGMQNGLSHMEWFRRPDGSVVISEIAARPPGAQIMSLMSYTTDSDVWGAWARLMIHGDYEVPQRRYAAGVAFLRGQGRGKVARLRGLAEAQKEVGSLVVEVTLPQVGASAKPGYEGEGFAIVRAEKTEDVARALETIIRRVRVDLA